MTSKNILWLGLLLLTLLTTTCIALYLDKYNPNIHYVETPYAEEQLPSSFSTKQEVETFVEQSIQPGISTIVQQKGKENNQTTPKENKKQKEPLSLKTYEQNSTFQNKENHLPMAMPTKIIAPKEFQKPQKHLKKVKSHKKLPSRKIFQAPIIIEQIITTKRITPPKANKIPSGEKRFLNRFVNLIKHNPSLIVKLELKKSTFFTKSYANKIKNYLLERGISQKNVIIQAKKRNRSILIEDATKQPKPFIDLTLIERISKL